VKKTWIKIKRGLLEPKHRETLGIRIWLYIHMLDRTDWDTGIIYGWKDKDEAEDLSMPWRTLQQQRQQLEKDGYIICKQMPGCQEITITNWTNPREYSGKVYNTTDGGTQSSVPTDGGSEEGGTMQGTNKGTNKTYSKSRTLPYNSHITNHTSGDAGIIFKFYEENIGLLTPFLSDDLGELIETYPHDWIIESMKIAVQNNKRKLSYAKAILKRWHIEGKDNGKTDNRTALEKAGYNVR